MEAVNTEGITPAEHFSSHSDLLEAVNSEGRFLDVERNQLERQAEDIESRLQLELDDERTLTKETEQLFQRVEQLKDGEQISEQTFAELVLSAHAINERHTEAR